MQLFLVIVAWCLLFVVAWPLALLVLVLFPLIWLVSLPFVVVGMVVSALFSFLRALLFLPARLLGSGR